MYASLGDPLLGGRHGSGVLLERMEQYHEVARALIEQAVARVREPERSSRGSPSICDVIGKSGGGASGGWPFRYSSM